MKFLAGFVLVVLLSVASVHAQQDTLNAGLVGSIWYDHAPVVFDTEIKIHSAFYNESESDILGNAVFRDNDTILGTVAFVAKPRSVTPLTLSWRTTEGVHALSVTIEGTDSAVVSAQSTVSLEIKKPVPVIPPKAPSTPVTLQSVKQTAVNTILDLTHKVDTYTGSLADSLQSEKIPTVSSSSPSPTSTEGEVLGIQSEENKTDSTGTVSNVVVKAKNVGVDGITWMVRNWQWGALILLVLFLLLLRKIRRRD